MQLLDLIKPIEQMTDDELQEHLQNIRHNRNFVRPAAAAKVKKAANKGSQGRVTKVKNDVDKMTPEQKQALIEQLKLLGVG